MPSRQYLFVLAAIILAQLGLTACSSPVGTQTVPAASNADRVVSAPTSSMIPSATQAPSPKQAAPMADSDRSGSGSAKFTLDPTGPWSISWVLSGCSDYYSASLQVDSVDSGSRVFGFLGMSGNPVDVSVPVGSTARAITETGSTNQFGSMSVNIQVPAGCSWSVHANQTPQSVAAAPSPADCARQIAPMLIKYGKGEVDITAVDALVPAKNRAFAHQQADDTRTRLEANPSLADDPYQLFGSGQVTVSLCAP